MRPETVEIISSPARKPARKSKVSSIISSTSDNEYSVNGVDSPIPELPWEGGYTALDKAPDNAISRRVHGIRYNLVVFIIGRTTSAARRPQYAQISLQDYRRRTGASERMIYCALASLQVSGYIAFDAAGGVKACPENFDKPALPAPRTCRRRAKEAAVHAPSPVAALQLTSVRIEQETVENEVQEAERQLFQQAAGNPSVGSDEAADRAVGNVDARSADERDSEECRDGVSDCGAEHANGQQGLLADDVGHGFERIDAGQLRELARSVCEGDLRLKLLQLSAVKTETDCRKPETYCPWNWTCPHLSTTSELVSIKQLISENPTTTATHAPAGENPYLARFLNPAQRIGDELGIDDVAATRMWKECSAVNPALTPREFLLIARMKLQEWRRVDDARPGLKVRRIVGLLIRSMPAAVQGALYLAAHEQAPDDLARDCSRAREILAGEASPRERAWALGILSESEA